MKLTVLLTVILCVVATTTGAAPYEELAPKYDRLKSITMVRKVTTPTLANLDYAAYHANPVIADKKTFRPKKPEEDVKLDEITFGGVLSNIANSIDETPLTENEKGAPLAWRPLVKRLWEVVKEPTLQNITSKVNGYKWADPGIYEAYQQIDAAFLHGSDIWVRVEFAHWVGFLENVTDEDEDGVKEVYGKVGLADMAPDSLSAALTWIREDYLVKTLDRQGVIDWITDWASYWYPTKNTDILESPEDGVWPAEDTERKVKRAMKKVTVKDPIAIVRGRPEGDIKKPIYNVYVVEGLEPEKEEESGDEAAVVEKSMDTAVSKNFKENTRRFIVELEKYGSYEKWAARNKPYLDAQRALLAGLPDGQMGFEGTDDWVFFRKSLEYTLAGDLADQPDDKNPLPHLKDLKAALDKRNVNLLFVVVPPKSEIYFEKLGAKAPSDATAVINPYGRKILSDIQTLGVEVIDLLPHLLKAKTQDAEHDEPVFQKQDTHWTNRGQQIAVELIVDRITQYSWYPEAEKSGVEFVIKDTTFLRQGDIVDKLPENVRATYPAVQLSAQQVWKPDGKLNRRTLAGPLLLMGDSFTGVFELIDCKGAGLVSHITARTGCTTGHLISWGGGPLVRAKLGRKADKILGAKRLVIYVMVARDLYNYAQGWAPLEFE